MVPRQGNLWEQVDLVNFGVLSSKIVGIQALGRAFSLHFAIQCLVLVKFIGVRLKQKTRETLMNKSDLHYLLLLSEKTDDMLSLGVAFSLVFMMESRIFE